MKLACTVAIILAAQVCVAAEVAFDDLIKSPARFDRERVTVTGLIEVNGDDNDLWRDAYARRRLDLKHSIHVVPDLRLPPYPGTNMSADSPANLHWVKVTGVVDASFRGRFGDERFGLLEEKIQILPGPRLREFLSILGWFRNETSETVYIKILFRDGYTSFGVWPHTLGMESITDDVHKRSTAVVSRTRDGNPIAKCDLMPRRSREQYYDAEKRAYYYRITPNKIEQVLPSEARKNWRLYPMPDRD
jgi:hypothetical protein